MTTNYTKMPQIIPNGRKIFQVVIKHFPFQGPPNFYQIWGFGFENKPSGNTGLDSERSKLEDLPFFKIFDPVLFT
jgi:hypothetical protein